jgi:hypothetical protein
LASAATAAAVWALLAVDVAVAGSIKAAMSAHAASAGVMMRI